MTSNILKVVAFLVVSAAVGNSDTAPSLGVPATLQQTWAEYSPWIPVASYAAPPTGCKVSQLQRHGARYPTKSTGEAIRRSLKEIQKVKDFKDPKYDFIKDYKYTLGLDGLLPYGAAQSFDAGHDHFVRYASLIDDKHLPFVRASNKPRVVESALNWTAGFAEASQKKFVPKLSVIISEKGNDTLDDTMCPKASKVTPLEKAHKWMEVFLPSIMKRINDDASGADLDKIEVASLMGLCALDTVAAEKASQWCDLFTQDEFASYEYMSDVHYYYQEGYGQDLGRVQGVGYVNELIARLTDQAVKDETQTDHTLDDSSATFPLDETFYADFSHDNEMVTIFAALGLFKQAQDLDPTKADPTRTWIISKMVPFSGRMITEKVTCERTGSEKDDYVRILVNDAVQPLDFCGAGKDGLCTLAKFVDSQSYARDNGDGDWKKCHGLL